MATDKENSCQNCSNDPNYAIICSFLEKFAQKCGVNHFNFLELQEMLENTVEVRQPLVELHIKLLRKLRKSCSADKWERVVTKFCHSYSKQDGWELERFGYKNSRIEVKLRLLKHLLEAQFDSNPKFKGEVNKLSADELRMEPLGRDQSGQTYWCQFDPSCNIRIYKEDPDEESWDLIAKDRVGLVNLIDDLCSGEGQKELNSILNSNEDSNSQEIEKPITDTGQVSSGTSLPETGEESLSQDVKQYSDSTNGSTEAPATTNQPVADADSDSNSRLPNTEKEPPSDDAKKVETKDKIGENVDASNVSTENSNAVDSSNDAPTKENQTVVVNKIIEEKSPALVEKLTKEDKSVKIEVSDKKDESLKAEVSIKKTFAIEKNPVSALTKQVSISKVPSKVSPEVVLSSKSEIEIKRIVDKSAVQIIPISSNMASQEDKRVNRMVIVADQNSNSSEEESSKSAKEVKSHEPFMQIGRGVTISKKSKRPPGSKLDEIFKFKRVHDPNTPTNLPPQSQPIPAYISPGVKKDSLAQIKEGVGSESKGRINQTQERSARLEERLGEISQRLGFKSKQLEIKVVKSNRSDDACQAEDLTKPKAKEPPVIVEPELKRQRLNEEPKFSEAVEEPLMLVRGEGSGADCNTGNPRTGSLFRNICDDDFEFGEAIEEPLMIFLGEGSGAECNTGNPEVEKNSEKPESTNSEGEQIEKSTDPNSEISQERKVHKLWSIDAICNKEKGENCDNSKQFFFGPGCFKDLDKCDQPVSNNNSLGKTNCDNEKTDDCAIKPKETTSGDDKDCSNKPDQCSSENGLNSGDASNSDLKESSKTNETELTDETSIKDAKNSQTEKDINDKDQFTPDVTDSLNKCVQPDNGKAISTTNSSADINDNSNLIDKSNISEQPNIIKSTSTNSSEDASDNSNVTDKSNICELPNSTNSSEDGTDNASICEQLNNVKSTGTISSSEDATDNSKVCKQPNDIKSTSTNSSEDATDNSKVCEQSNDIKSTSSNSSEDAADNSVADNSMACEERNNIESSGTINSSEDVTDNLTVCEQPNNIESSGTINSSEDATDNSTVCEQPNNIESSGTVNSSEDATDNSNVMDSSNQLQSTSNGAKVSASFNLGENIVDNSEKDKIARDIDSKSPKSIESGKDATDKLNEKGSDTVSETPRSTNSSANESSNSKPIKKEKINVEKSLNKNSTVDSSKTLCENDGLIVESKNKSVTCTSKMEVKKISDNEGVNSSEPAEIKSNIKDEVKIESPEVKVGDCDVEVKTEVECSKLSSDKEIESKDNIENKSSKQKDSGANDGKLKVKKEQEEIDKTNDNDNEIAKNDSKKASLNKAGKSNKATKSRRDSKVKEEEIKEEEPQPEEHRRPRRSAALIATQLSENIIKPRSKKAPAPTKQQEEKKNAKKEDVAKEDDKKQKNQPAKGKGKKTPTKKQPTRKKSTEAEQNVDRGDIVDTEDKKDDAENADSGVKTFGLNAFSFDVDASGNIPQMVSMLSSRKRRLNSGGVANSDDDDDEEQEDDDDAPLAVKKQRLRGKTSKKKSPKSKKQSHKKKSVQEAESSSDEDEAESAENKSNKKKQMKDQQTQSKQTETKDFGNQPKPKRGSKNLLGLTPLDLLGVEKVEEDAITGRSIRTSRRIAQIKIREQEEERKLVDETIKEEQIKKKQRDKQLKKKHSSEREEKKSSKKKSSSKLSDGDFTPYDQDSNDTFKKKKGGRPKKKSLMCKYDINNPWKSSSGSGTSEEENDDLEHYDIEEDEEEDLRAKKLESDHEFSPESDLENADQDGIPVRHARTALKGETKEEEEDDTSCEKCGKSDHPEWILLCDKCDNGWHGSCLRPALMIVPEGDWFCPPCQHLSLVEKLKETLRIFEKDSKRRENDELRRKRLAYVGISLSNVLPPPGTKVRLDDSSSSSRSGSDSGSRSGSQSRSSSDSSSYEDEPVYQLRVRSKTVQSYRFNDYDQLINSAIQDEMEEVAGAGNQGRGKDIQNIVEAERDEPNGHKMGEEEDEGGEGWRPPVVPRKAVNSFKKKSRKLTSIDVSSEDDKDSDEDFKGSLSSPSSEESDSGSSYSGGRAVPVRRSTRARTSRIDKDFINDDTSGSDAPRRKKSRKVWSETESESDETWGARKRRSGGGNKVISKNRKKKKSRYSDDSDSDEPRKPKTKKSKVRYGLSDDDDYGRKTRGTRKKVNYQESDSDENAPQVVKVRRVIESDDEEDYNPEPSDKKRAIVSESDEEEYSEDDEQEEEEDKDEEERDKIEEDVEPSDSESKDKPVINNVKDKTGDDSASVSEKSPAPLTVPASPVTSPTSEEKKVSDVEMFMGDIEEEDEELDEEEEDEDEEEQLKIDIPPLRHISQPKPPELPAITIKPTSSLQSVKDKLVQEELNDELRAVPGPIPKVVPVPVPQSEIKDKELEKPNEKTEEKKDQPKVNSIRIVPQHKLMANPPPQLEVKPMMARPRVPGPHPPGGIPAPYPGVRFPPRSGVSMMRHGGSQFPGSDPAKYYPPQYPPYYPQQQPHHFPDDYPPSSGGQNYTAHPPVHPAQQAFTSQGEEGEFGGLVSYFSSQHEDDLDS